MLAFLKHILTTFVEEAQELRYNNSLIEKLIAFSS